MNNINTIKAFSNSSERFSHPPSVIEPERMDQIIKELDSIFARDLQLRKTNQTMLQYIRKTKTISSTILKVYAYLPSQKNMPLEKSLTDCFEVVHYLKQEDSRLPRITSVILDYATLITNKNFDKLHYFAKELSQLFLVTNIFENKTIPSLYNFSCLKTLKVGFCTFDHTAKDFCPPSLENLSFTTCRNFPESLDLSSASNLKKLRINSCNGIKTIQNLSRNLELLKLTDCNILGIMNFRSYPNLSVLKIKKCQKIANLPIENIPSSLKTLHFSPIIKIIPILNCSNVEELYIEANSQLDPQTNLQFLSKVIGIHLKKLDLSSLSSLRAVPDLEDCPNLEELKIRSGQIELLSKGLSKSKLRKISLAGCTGLSAVDPVYDTKLLLSNEGDGITDLDLSECPAFIDSLKDIIK